MAAYESYWHAHGVPAYAQASARQGLIREHADRGHAGIALAEAERGDPGSRSVSQQTQAHNHNRRETGP